MRMTAYIPTPMVDRNGSAVDLLLPKRPSAGLFSFLKKKKSEPVEKPRAVPLTVHDSTDRAIYIQDAIALLDSHSLYEIKEMAACASERKPLYHRLVELGEIDVREHSFTIELEPASFHEYILYRSAEELEEPITTWREFSLSYISQAVHIAVKELALDSNSDEDLIEKVSVFFADTTIDKTRDNGRYVIIRDVFTSRYGDDFSTRFMVQRLFNLFGLADEIEAADYNRH